MIVGLLKKTYYRAIQVLILIRKLSNALNFYENIVEILVTTVG